MLPGFKAVFHVPSWDSRPIRDRAEASRSPDPTNAEPENQVVLGETACPSVPSMGRILLDERSQPEPMTVTVVNRKA